MIWQLRKEEILRTKVNKIIDQNGVKIIGEMNILNKLPISASSLYAKIYLICFKFIDKTGKISINLEDEIVKNTN